MSFTITQPDGTVGAALLQTDRFFRLKKAEVYFERAFVGEDFTLADAAKLFTEAEEIPVFDVSLKRQQELISAVENPIGQPTDPGQTMPWEPGHLALPGNLCHDEAGETFECLQKHVTQRDWSPADTPALWKLLPKASDGYPEWIQPAGAHDAYAKGAVVSYKDKLWISTAKDNVWAPGVYGWSEYTEDK
jgi:hypothetical protein